MSYDYDVCSETRGFIKQFLTAQHPPGRPSLAALVALNFATPPPQLLLLTGAKLHRSECINLFSPQRDTITPDTPVPSADNQT